MGATEKGGSLGETGKHSPGVKPVNQMAIFSHLQAGALGSMVRRKALRCTAKHGTMIML